MLSDYLNLELPPDACAQIESHLADCAPCIEFAESLRRTVELCRRYRPEEMPAPIGEEARRQLLDAWRKTSPFRAATSTRSAIVPESGNG